MNVRADGLAAVLGPVLDDRRVRSAALLDVDSGMVLDACGDDRSGAARGPGHAELVRTALVVAPGPGGCEIVVHAADGTRHVVHTLPDPYGGRLALAVVVDGTDRAVARLRRRLRAVSAAALTAGPTTALRPTENGWRPGGCAAGSPGPAAIPVRSATIAPAPGVTDRPSADRAVVDQVTVDRVTADHATADHATADHATADHATAGPVAAGRTAVAPGPGVADRPMPPAALPPGPHHPTPAPPATPSARPRGGVRPDERHLPAGRRTTP